MKTISRCFYIWVIIFFRVTKKNSFNKLQISTFNSSVNKNVQLKQIIVYILLKSLPARFSPVHFILKKEVNGTYRNKLKVKITKNI